MLTPEVILYSPIFHIVNPPIQIVWLLLRGFRPECLIQMKKRSLTPGDQIRWMRELSKVKRLGILRALMCLIGLFAASLPPP